jgi:hypothetical protein
MQVFVLQRQLIIFTLGENKSNQSPLSSPIHTEGNTNPFSDTNVPKPGSEMDIGALHPSINLFLLRKLVYSMIICSVALLSLVLQPGYLYWICSLWYNTIKKLAFTSPRSWYQTIVLIYWH